MNHVSHIVPPKVSTMPELSMLQSAVGYSLTSKLFDIPTLKFHPDCGNSLAAKAGRAPASDCGMKCPGNTTEFCGRSNGLMNSILFRSLPCRTNSLNFQVAQTD